MVNHKRLIPSLAVLSVSLTGCGEDVASDDITGNWDVTVLDGMDLPIYNYSQGSITGGRYDGFAASYSYSMSGTLAIDATGVAELIGIYSYSYSSVYSGEFEGYGNESYSDSCTYSYNGMSKSLGQRRFEIRFDSATEACEDSDGNADWDFGPAEMNLDCVLHPNHGVVDCIDRIDGSYWAFERSDTK